MNDFAHAEISNFDLSLLGHKKVLQLQVSMDYPHLVQIFDSIDQRSKNSP